MNVHYGYHGEADRLIITPVRQNSEAGGYRMLEREDAVAMLDEKRVLDAEKEIQANKVASVRYDLAVKLPKDLE